MKPKPHQQDMADRGLAILRKHMLVYLVGEERTGKTLSSIMICEQLKASTVLVVTKKKALDGWAETLEAYHTDKKYIVVNYHQIHKVTDSYDIVILDEAHNYVSGYPKPSKFWFTVAKYTKNKPIIYLSATPNAQGYQLLYHQLKLSSWNPWKRYDTFYDWHSKFGIEDKVYTAGGIPRETYKKVDPKVFDTVSNLFVSKRRSEAGFKHEPVDKLHYVQLSDKAIKVYNALLKHRAIILNGYELVCDTISKLRPTLHMLEGGTYIRYTKEEVELDKFVAYLEKNKQARVMDIYPKALKLLYKLVPHYEVLGNTEKIDYILKNWGDSSDVVIMYHYIAEEIKLRKYFKNATILQATSYAEGVDLSMYEHLIIYSQDFSTARYSQRRARQINMNLDKPRTVHYILTKGGISDEAYTTVAVNKKNYVDSMFKGKELNGNK